MSEDKDYKIGYGKTPITTRFKKGQSGNPKGRPKKKIDPNEKVQIDFESFFSEQVEIGLNGRKINVHTKEAQLLKFFEQATKGHFSSIKYLFKDFAKYQCIEKLKEERVSNVVILPDNYETPYEISLMLFKKYGRPPWTKQEIDSLQPERLKLFQENREFKIKVLVYEDYRPK